MPFPHVVIRASAGTGKTFQLTNRFLGLAGRDELPDQVLAATFARKAAGEILDRVLTRLAEAAADPDKLAALAGHLDITEFDRPRCLRLLKALIGRLHRLRIGTLDSFFIQLAGSFGLELGLPPGWRIVDEIIDRNLRTEAVQAVLRNEKTGDMVTLVRLLSKGEVRRSVAEQLADIVNDLYALYLQTPRDAWHALPRRSPLTETELAEALARLESLDGLPSNKHFTNAHATNIASARRDDWPEFVGKGLAAAIAGKKETFQRCAISPEVVEAYRPLIEHARAAIVGDIALQTEATWSLLDKFDAAYQQLKTSRRALRFEDVTRRLAGGLSGLTVEAIAYRLDSHIAHLLLDEFQDTSLQQWDVLRPFARAVTGEAAGRSFFCVGDVKQAIYGWRGGVSEVFDAIEEQLPGLTLQPLNESRRSCQVVIDTVNAVFGNLASCPPLADYPEVTMVWADRFAQHTTALKHLCGQTRLTTAPEAAEGQAQDEATLTYAAEQVARLAGQCPDRTIGVLVRRNQAVARLIHELRSRHQLLASEEGGNPLIDSPAVRLVLSAMILADHPGDTLARFHLAHSPLGPVLGLDDHKNGEAALRLSLRIRETLMTRGYGRTVYGWVRTLAPACDSRELNRLLQLVELAWGYEAEATVRADDFVNFVSARKVEDPTAARVRVMTIHQAKGLQFDIVVLPELHGRLAGQPGRVVLGRPRAIDPIDRVCRYAGEKVRPLLPREFQKMFDADGNQWVNEALCVLYVAMTRAVHALHMIVPPAPQEKTVPKTFAGVLRGTLAPGIAPEPETLLYEHGDPHWDAKRDPAVHTAAKRQASSPPEAETLTIRLAPRPPRRTRGLERQSPSGLEGGTRVDLARRLKLDNARALSRGSLLHAWFEQIAWLDDGPPDDTVLQRIAREFPDVDFSAELASFRRLLTRPAIRQALSRDGYDDLAPFGFPAEVQQRLRSGTLDLQVLREHPFAVRDGDALLQGAIDRLVLLKQDGQSIAADILDFKSDALSPDAPAALDAAVEHYRPQLEAYRRATARLTGLPPAAISSRLLFLGPGLVRWVR